ncbi:MAG: polymer-forming cytoskeletal protein [Rhodospirillaceae bacterium]|nr:polymer-forming cytoskeletal protein [Rhodospirillaceae bacterium]
MFRRKNNGRDGPSTQPTDETAEHDAAAKPAAPRAAPLPATKPVSAPTARAEPAGRRLVELTSQTGWRSGQQVPEPETKKLIVGRDICLSGEITSCDRLVVEGRVEATLSESRFIEITENGFFKGTAEVDGAEIGGRFEGSLIVRERLFIRSTGRITGSVRYGKIEIELGGELAGDLQVTRPSPTLKPVADTASPSSALGANSDSPLFRPVETTQA